MENNGIYTIGYLLSNKLNKAYKIDLLVKCLKELDIKTVLDLRNIKDQMNGPYAPKELKTYLASENMGYLSRTEETYLFYEVLKNKNISDQPAKTDFFQTYYFFPLINYLQNLDINHKPLALLFTHWEIRNWMINSGRMQNNLKGSFCEFIYRNKIDLNILHLVPPKKNEVGLDVFSNQDLFKLGCGSLLNIKEDIYWKSKPSTHNVFDPDPFADFDLGEESRRIGADEMRGLNEESDGAAYWNID